MDYYATILSKDGSFCLQEVNTAGLNESRKQYSFGIFGSYKKIVEQIVMLVLNALVLVLGI